MLEIARFYGRNSKILWNSHKIVFGDHPPPHFHAVYGEHVGLFNIDTLEMIEGDLQKRAEKLVVEWATINKKELESMWDSQEFRKLQPLD